MWLSDFRDIPPRTLGSLAPSPLIMSVCTIRFGSRVGGEGGVGMRRVVVFGLRVGGRGGACGGAGICCVVVFGS